MYNVLAKLRAGEALTPAERTIHQQGLVAVLWELHDEIDRAVLEAYCWQDLSAADDSDAVLLERLVALNTERAAEERQGLIRWLRPAFQAPGDQSLVMQTELDATVAAETRAPLAARP